MKNNLVRRRLFAYIIDLFIVSMIVSVILIGHDNRESIKREKELEDIVSKYTKEEITTEEYFSEYTNIVYEASQDNFDYNLIFFIVSLGYFLIFQYLNDGASIGKKLLKIKIVNNKKDKIRLWQLIIRVGLVNELFSMFLLLLFTKLLKGIPFLICYGGINFIGNIIIILCGITFILNKKGIALHDKVSGSVVVMDEK